MVPPMSNRNLIAQLLFPATPHIAMATTPPLPGLIGLLSADSAELHSIDKWQMRCSNRPQVQAQPHRISSADGSDVLRDSQHWRLQHSFAGPRAISETNSSYHPGDLDNAQTSWSVTIGVPPKTAFLRPASSLSSWLHYEVSTVWRSSVMIAHDSPPNATKAGSSVKL
ncbi:hypothetical protein ASPVEDRAFT_29777 [Aspergillus versicolor CBS 583.65]|uniref:Uncharacterized protein n=1 Tax=Aspergillus versicolor CBS 583.65 TaxID=1036611 RepID=A0A1L9PNZ5_ASPVE|nr:uncharacterized protein ASPVEDRAFT_29777 [Aspergillus versicolor CBS 583.65]OJJ03254.1 hypothetical protein ASPVEDRAFT_29777 [Aspergillus versicolor CBS 583.65]